MIAIELLLLNIYQADTTVFGRIIFGYISLIIILALLYILKLITRLNNSVHKSYSTLFSLLSNKSIRMSIKQRMKILSFTEKLSGPHIGFYCLDLFPLNNFEVFQAIYIAVSNYFLIMGLF